MALARSLGGEIVSADSMQVYRGMDIGTAKPTADERAEVPHHLIDIADPSEAYSVADYQRAGREVLAGLAATERAAVICGGSGLHFRSLVDPLEFPPTDEAMRQDLEQTPPVDLVAELIDADPDAAAVVDLANPRRVLRAVEIHRLTGVTPTERADDEAAAAVRDYVPVFPFTAIGIDPGDALRARVVERLERMVAAGWVEEAGRLAGRLGPTAAGAVGYAELAEVAAGRQSLAEAKASIVDASLSLAKRQRTFFRRDPRISWLAWHDEPDRIAQDAVASLEEAGAWTS